MRGSSGSETSGGSGAGRDMSIDLGENLSVEQRATLMRSYSNYLPHARMLTARKRQGVDDTRKGIEAAQRQFSVQEAEIESGLMGHERRAVDESNELLRELRKRRR